MGILLFLLSINYSIGVGSGRYMPGLEQLKLWANPPCKSRMGSSATIRVDNRLSVGKFSLTVGINYFSTSPYTVSVEHSLRVIPIDINLSYRIWLLPALLGVHTGIGYERCFATYEGIDGTKYSGWGNGVQIIENMNFVAISWISIDLFGGYKFATVNEVKSKDGTILTVEAKKDPIPIELNGLLWGITLRHRL